mmetsp:Transcript_80801/g.233674  ORF Transcript_80801/g.233674 Transcript_80801/m.233674 type:complete len:97 (+) Transcript_80801:1047-1337(+)
MSVAVETVITNMIAADNHLLKMQEVGSSSKRNMRLRNVWDTGRNVSRTVSRALPLAIRKASIDSVVLWRTFLLSCLRAGGSAILTAARRFTAILRS